MKYPSGEARSLCWGHFQRYAKPCIYIYTYTYMVTDKPSCNMKSEIFILRVLPVIGSSNGSCKIPSFCWIMPNSQTCSSEAAWHQSSLCWIARGTSGRYQLEVVIEVDPDFWDASLQSELVSSNAKARLLHHVRTTRPCVRGFQLEGTISNQNFRSHWHLEQQGETCLAGQGWQCFHRLPIPSASPGFPRFPLTPFALLLLPPCFPWSFSSILVDCPLLDNAWRLLRSCINAVRPTEGPRKWKELAVLPYPKPNRDVCHMIFQGVEFGPVRTHLQSPCSFLLWKRGQWGPKTVALKERRVLVSTLGLSMDVQVYATTTKRLVASLNYWGGRKYGNEISWQCSWRSSGDLSGPFCPETLHFHVWYTQVAPTCSCECSFELCHSKSFLVPEPASEVAF